MREDCSENFPLSFIKAIAAGIILSKLHCKAKPMNFINIIISLTYALLLLLVIIKSVLFFKSTSYRNISRYIYFNTESIYNSASPQKERAKVLQNRLSVAIAIAGAFALAVTFIILK